MFRISRELDREYVDLFNQQMGMRDAEGRLLKTANEDAVSLVKAFVTERGRLDSTIADRLGGQPAYGRADVLLDLVRALTGPDPIPQAWLDAQRHGGFDLFVPEFYRGKRKSGASRSLGTPGVYLQRMFAQWRADVNNFRRPEPMTAALYAEASLLTGAIVVKSLQKAVCAKSALGSAWVVNLAVDRLPGKIKQQLDALASNEGFLGELGDVVAGVVAKYDVPDNPRRTMDQVQHSLPVGADVEAFFAEHHARELAAAAESSAVGCNDPIVQSSHTEETSCSNDVDPAAWLASALKKATDYLSASVHATDEELAAHHERLRFLMPDLSHDRSAMERRGIALLMANTHLLSRDYGAPHFFRDAPLDALFKAVVHEINAYALNNGPPPPLTPIEHLPYFAAAANAFITAGWNRWPARDRWQAAGLLLAEEPVTGDISASVCDIVEDGLSGLDIARASSGWG